MIRTRLGMIGAALLAVASFAPTAADAQYHGRPGDGGDHYGRSGAGWNGGYGRPDGYGRGYDAGDRRGYGGNYGYNRGRQGYRGRGYRCDRGTGGTIIGAIAGGLLGNQVAGRGDRTLGAVAGAGVGALAGRAIDRDC